MKNDSEGDQFEELKAREPPPGLEDILLSGNDEENKLLEQLSQALNDQSRFTDQEFVSLNREL